MSARELLVQLREKGVEVKANGDRLVIDAPRGAITPDLRDALSANKAELLQILTAPPIERTAPKPAPVLIQAPVAAPGTCQQYSAMRHHDRRNRKQSLPRDLRSLKRPTSSKLNCFGCARKKKHAVLNSKRPVLLLSMLLIRLRTNGGRNRKRPRADALSTRSCGSKRKHANVRLKRPAVASLRPNWLASKKN